MRDSDIKNNISKNLDKYMDIKQINNRELASVLGVSESTVGKWRLEKTIPRMGYIEQMANYFGIEKSDLLENNIENLSGIKIMKKFKDVPILGDVACGEPIFCYENYDGLFRIDVDLDDPDFCLTARGDSMIDVGIHEGDIIFFKKTPTVDNGKIAAILIEDDVTLKRFYKRENEIILQPENKKYSPITIRESDKLNVSILGEMIGMYTKGSK